MTQLSGSKVLITGGAGFVGSHLAERLLADGQTVTVLDNLSSGNKENLSGNLSFVEGDIRDDALVDKLVKDADRVYHFAEYIPETAKFGPGHVIKFSVSNPLLDFDVSCAGSLHVLDKCRKYDKEIVFTSSAAVYGENKDSTVNEDIAVVPSSPYGASKYCAEVYMNLYSRLYSLPVTILRFCNVYGPRQKKYLMYDILAKLSKDPNRLEVLGTGQERRDFIYVSDVIDAVLLAAQSPKPNGIVFNVGTGQSISIKETIQKIVELSGLHPKICFTQSSWDGDIRKLGANVEKLRALGFNPKYSLDEGLKETINWFNKIYK